MSPASNAPLTLLSSQRWNLMPYAVVISSVTPTSILRCADSLLHQHVQSISLISICRGRRQTLGLFPGEHNFNRFPAWLVRALAMQPDGDWVVTRGYPLAQGKNSSAGKQRRIVGEVQAHTLVSGVCFANRCVVRDVPPPRCLALSNWAHAGLPSGRSTCQHCGSP